MFYEQFRSMGSTRILFSLFFLVFLSVNIFAQASWPIFLPIVEWGNVEPAHDNIPTRPNAWPSMEFENAYYIDNTNSLATDTNNPFGYPDLPRMTIPEITYAAGSYIEVSGGPYFLTAGDLQFNFNFNGNQDSICWMFCDTLNRVEIQGETRIDGSYLIMDGFHFDRNVTMDKKTEVEILSSDHICLRNALVKDDGVFHSGFGAGININGDPNDETTDVIIFNSVIRDLDDIEYSRNVAQDDNNGILAGPNTENIYIVSNKIFRCAGDGVVTNGNNVMGADRANKVFVVNNDIYDNGENAFDIKSGTDVVIAENRLHGYVEAAASDGTAIVVQQEGGSGSENVWVLFNEIYDSELSIRVEEDVTDCYFIGNLVRDQASDYASVYVRTNTAELSVIDNTIVRYDHIGFRWDNFPNIDVHGNVFALRDDPIGYEMRASNSSSDILIDNNLYDDSMGIRLRFLYPTYTNLLDWQLNNPENWDTLSSEGIAGFIDPTNNDFKIDATSAARNVSTEHPAYDEFYNHYGINIERDFNGIIRAHDGNWDRGAFEHFSGCTSHPTNVWVGGNDNWYGSADNWSLNRWPQSCDHVILPDLSVVDLHRAQEVEIYTLDVAVGACLEVAADAEFSVIVD